MNEQPIALRRAFRGAATGRIVWGVLALLAPRLNARLAGGPDRVTPEVIYLIRVFGSRALALGLGYLLSDRRARERWQRLCLIVDVSDTVAGLSHLVRGDVRRGSAAALTAVTGTYAALGVAGVLTTRAPAAAAEAR